MPNLTTQAPARRVQIMDTTLRDGEQTPQVAYTPAEKLHIARVLLCDVRVDRIEVGSTGVSAGEREALRRIIAWSRGAGCLDQVEVLGFCDAGASARWMAELGARRMNLLTKGSEHHCRVQLRSTLAQHLAAIEESVAAASALGIRVTGAYLEDWSRGIVDAPDYVMALSERLLSLGVAQLFLADTLGCLAPDDVARHVTSMLRTFPGARFELHAHNDYGLAIANALAGVAAGACGVHSSVNGLGERAGNASLSELVVALHDHAAVTTGVDERALQQVARLVETYSGKLLADNTPVVGRDVFTQTAGIHADGDRKGDLYASRLSPSRFGRRYDYALGKLSGRASLDQNLTALGIVLEAPERDRLLARIVELGDQKRSVHVSDLPFLINDLLGRSANARVQIRDYTVTVQRGHTALAQVELELDGRRTQAQGRGSGGYDALMTAVRSAAGQLGLTLPVLRDFRVRIPPEGGTSALVETVITFGAGDEEITTFGVDSDQIGAAVIATEKMLQLVVKRGELAKSLVSQGLPSKTSRAQSIG